jgi:hypothetical protein
MLTAYLWTDGAVEPPWQYIEFILCRDIYHTLPSELRKEKASDILQHMICMNVEQSIKKRRER